MAVKFSPAVLSSEAMLDAYMHGKETIDAIKAAAKNTYVKGQGSLGGFEMAWLMVTAPAKQIIVIFIKASGYLCFYLFNAKKQGCRLLAQATYIDNHSLRWNAWVIHRHRLLVDTVNVLSPSHAEEVYSHPPFSVAKIPKHVRLRFDANIRDKHLHFAQNIQGGQCAGMSNWFAYLYFQTKRFFKNEEQHLVAVASQLKNGAGKEATLWQYGQLDDSYELAEYDVPPLLGLKKRNLEKMANPTVEKITGLLKRLEPGLYTFRTCHDKGRHRMNFYKGTKCNYVFDPNEGLIKLNSKNELKDWVQEAAESYLFSKKPKNEIALKIDRICHVAKKTLIQATR